MTDGGYKNYLLVNKDTGPNYPGMQGPGYKRSDLERRHSGTRDRFDPANDRVEYLPGERTYGEARLKEQLEAEKYKTYIGRDSDSYRGNRQNPMDDAKRARYQQYVDGC